jgi:hypothetical protein
MSTTLRLPSRSRTSRRAQVLAGASALVAAASVAVALAFAGGGGDAATGQPSAAPATATPDRATLYRNEATLGGQAAEIEGLSPAERYHHFR